MTGKIDLTLLKRLVSEVEQGITTAEKLKLLPDGKNDYIVEMSRTTGLLAGIMTEATMLVGDVQTLLSGAPPLDKSSIDALTEKLFGKPGAKPNSN